LMSLSLINHSPLHEHGRLVELRIASNDKIILTLMHTMLISINNLIIMTISYIPSTFVHKSINHSHQNFIN
ncbi:hypothetical protein VIGAN_10007400, partial [Vigna angularis var. angularis]